jgi:hypothetical protein
MRYPCATPHVGVQPFHQKSTCSTKFTLGRYVVQIWSRTTSKTSPKETRAAHPVEPLVGEQIVAFNCFDSFRKSPESGKRLYKPRAWNSDLVQRFGPAPPEGPRLRDQSIWSRSEGWWKQAVPVSALPATRVAPSIATRLPHWPHYRTTSPTRKPPSS